MKYKIAHPAGYIQKELTDRIRNAAFEAEQQGRLPEAQLSIIYAQQWFKMFVPKHFGGLELPLPEILKIEECLSWTDGSTAWVVTLCSGAAWFTGFMDTGIVQEICQDNHLMIAGSGAVTGIASIETDSYELNGYWKYASGADYATAFTVNCHLTKDNHLLYTADGTPVVRSFLLKKDEVQLHHTWKAMGMVATGSHSFEAKKLKLPANRCFIIDAAHAKLAQPLYQYPFLQLAETTLAVNISGMAVRFMDLCEDIFMHKPKSDRNTLLQLLTNSQHTLDERRYQFYEKTDASWQALVTEKNIPDALLESVSKVSHALAHDAQELVYKLYRHCGLLAAQTDHEINRVWRDISTAGQHSLFNRN